MDGKLVTSFLNAYGVDPYAPAGIEYKKYMNPDFDKAQIQAEEKIGFSEKDQKDKAEIEAAVDADSLVRLMRRKMSATNTALLRERLLRVQKVVNLPIMERILTSGQDVFAQNAFYFLVHCDANYSLFLYQEYENVRSEYMKSMICLALGILGQKEMLPMLMQEAKRMSVHFPQESFYQGAVIGAMELGARTYGTPRLI